MKSNELMKSSGRKSSFRCVLRGYQKVTGPSFFPLKEFHLNAYDAWGWLGANLAN